MESQLEAAVRWLLGPEIPSEKRPGHLWPRWIFLRALGIIYFSAFYSFLFQIRGLIGPNGILPAGDYLQAVSAQLHSVRYWIAPTLLWFSSSDRALMIICWAGIVASVLAFFNVWPRASLVVAFICFLSFIAAAQDFASYQSDGMLLEAGFISLFFAPAGFRPGLGSADAPRRAALYLLRWEWFRIYFESGFVKMASHDYSWRHFTAMDDYYQNGPLPTWIGYYVQHLPHWFHASTVFLTLSIELVLVWMVFLPRRFRIICFWIVTPFEIAIILTANYAFLNYIVLSLGFLLLDDRFVEWIVPERVRNLFPRHPVAPAPTSPQEAPPPASQLELLQRFFAPIRMAIAGICLAWVFYAATAELLWMFLPTLPLPTTPVEKLEGFRIANQYGLFARMTHKRYEIEFQGQSDDGAWIPYPFRYKPQELNKAPGIYAPYQPRFEWNLWFASLGAWPQYRFVVWTEERLLHNEPDVLELFKHNPFPSTPPDRVRAVIYQYWFTDMKAKHASGNWWTRELLGIYAPELEREPDGKIVIVDIPIVQPSPP